MEESASRLRSNSLQRGGARLRSAHLSFFCLVLFAQEAVLCYWFRALFICELVITCLEDGLVASSICFALLRYLVYSLFCKLSWVCIVITAFHRISCTE
jgi:hypothetical protein